VVFNVLTTKGEGTVEQTGGTAAIGSIDDTQALVRGDGTRVALESVAGPPR
jgi:hypothetical protein